LRKLNQSLTSTLPALLRARFEELFGEESRSSNHAHLFRRIAWRLQANAEGDLSERARKRALELAEDAGLRAELNEMGCCIERSGAGYVGGAMALTILKKKELKFKPKLPILIGPKLTWRLRHSCRDCSGG
jgi:hypothetical protein